MRHAKQKLRDVTVIVLISVIVLCFPIHSWSEAIPFDSDKWVKTNAQVTEHLGRQSIIGFAYLEGVEFENGVIEVDIALTGARSYPGIVFRMQSQRDYERFYVRPHRAGLYPDALQYTPVINGIAGWQLYNGNGYTAGAEFAENEWIHFRMEVSGSQARIYIGESDRPALVMPWLQHGVSRGTIGVYGPGDGSAFFSNFSYTINDNLNFGAAPPIDTPPGIISGWQLSKPFALSDHDIETYPGKKKLDAQEWQDIQAEVSGLVDIARYHGRTGREPDCIFARTMIHADKKEKKKLSFGYSDAVTIFLNGELLFLGNSAYRHRDPSFLGIVGLNDAVYLPLRKGENELLLVVAEAFGGWGYICQDGTAIFMQAGMNKEWETDKAFLVPETVLFDSKREVLYVTNFDAYRKGDPGEGQYLSRVSLKGEIIEEKWVTGLANPTGMAIHDDRLCVLERGNLVEIDIDKGEIVKRHVVPQSVFINDIAIDESGRIYISDSSKNVIFRFSGGAFEEWLHGPEIVRPNGLHALEGLLIFGNNGDNRVKSADLETGEVRTIANLGSGIIDGIEDDGRGNLLVSHWEGRVYRILPSGVIVKVLDTTVPECNAANFEYIVEDDRLIIPTFADNRIMMYVFEK